MTKTLTGRTRFRVGKEGLIFKKIVLILEVEEILMYDLEGTDVVWRDATMADVSTSRETGKEEDE